MRTSPYVDYRTVGVAPYLLNRPARCPKCGSKRIAWIYYGLPRGFQIFVMMMMRGRITPGGCSIMLGHSPVWRCRDCHTGIGTVER